MEIKYDTIGSGYNLTRKADAHLTEQLLLHLNPNKTGKYLDIGCGTGNYTSALQEKGFQFIGIDPSREMLEKAKLNNSEVDWRIGSAEDVGLPENSVNGIIGSLTIHHWTDLKKSFSQLNSVLIPTGRIVIFTATPEQMNGYWLHHYFPKMLSDSMKQMPTLNSVEMAMKENDIKILDTVKYFIKPDLEDHFLYCGKHNPELYFEDRIRQGISSFSSLANRAEIESGLSKLKTDIDSGKIDEIIRSYENDLGDYLFVIARKASA